MFLRIIPPSGLDIITPKPVKPPDQKPEDFTGFLPSDRESFRSCHITRTTSIFYRSDFRPDGTCASRLPDDGDVASSTVILGDGPLVTVPDFSGWAARRVAQECEKLGLDLNIVGSGLAVEQNPARARKCLPAPAFGCEWRDESDDRDPVNRLNKINSSSIWLICWTFDDPIIG